jgi:hypothetical protein
MEEAVKSKEILWVEFDHVGPNVPLGEHDSGNAGTMLVLGF